MAANENRCQDFMELQVSLKSISGMAKIRLIWEHVDIWSCWIWYRKRPRVGMTINWLCYTRLPLGELELIPLTVVFPAPFGPRSPKISPCFTKNEISMITLFSAKNFDTLSNFTVCIQIQYFTNWIRKSSIPITISNI